MEHIGALKIHTKQEEKKHVYIYTHTTANARRTNWKKSVHKVRHSEGALSALPQYFSIY